jgi:hypothetical protein
MKIQSLGYRTDLIFPRFEGRIADRGDYLVITTPSNPTFWWGNFILFRRPPQQGAFERWVRVFTEKIGPLEKIGHMTFGIDSTDGDAGTVQPFLDSGFQLKTDIGMTAQEVNEPPRLNTEAEVRPIRSDEE